MTEKNRFSGLSSFTLHVLAMAFMLCDHVWAAVLPQYRILTCIGRIAFPIFAFMAVEGYFYTKNLKKYLSRLFLFALISEIPFNLFYGGNLTGLSHQNVLWTFLLGLLLVHMVETTKHKGKVWLTVLASIGAILIGLIVGTVTMVDYYGAGVLTVLVFYFFRGKKWWCYLGQLVGMYYVNVELLGGFYYPIYPFGIYFELEEQSLAMLSLIPIWLYRGRQGYHAKWFQQFCYWFYPVHMLILYFLWRFL